MMNRLLAIIAIAIALLAPARAQFADQATFVASGGGTANVQTFTLANASSYADMLGVLVKVIPGATNTAAATFNFNSFGTVALRKLSGAALVALTGGEVVDGQPILVMYDGTYFDIMSPTSDTVGARMLGNSALSNSAPTNLSLSATASADTLVLAVQTSAGGTPSSSTPVLMSFRNATAATGTPLISSIQAALGFTIGTSEPTYSLGCTTAVLCRLWIVAFYNGGTPALCAINVNNGTSIAAINEYAVQTSASGTTGGTSAQTYYCNVSAVTSSPIRILGYVEGTWTSGMGWTGVTTVQLFGPGIKKPGDIVQTVTSSSTTQSTTTATTTPAVFSPAVTQAIVTSSAANLVRVSIFGSMTAGVAVGHVQFARSTTLIGILLSAAPSTGQMPASLAWIDAPATSGSVTYNLYGASNSGATLTWAPTGSGYYWQLDEIMGALPEPANDNGGPLRMVG